MIHYKTCKCCNTEWIIDDSAVPVIIMPWPHVDCPKCGQWIPLF